MFRRITCVRLALSSIRHISLAHGKPRFQSLRCFSSNKLDLLNTLPEYKNAGEHALKGQFLQAIPLFQRVIHVLESSVGSTSELALHTVVEQVKVLIKQGDYDKAEQLLEQTQSRLLDKSNKTEVDVTNWEVTLLQWTAFVSFLRQENHSSQTASHLVDRLTAAEPSDLSLYTPAFSLKGLTHLHQGELEDAEDELQKAARWSQNLEQKMITLNNLGALTWAKLGHYCPTLPQPYLYTIPLCTVLTRLVLLILGYYPNLTHTIPLCSILIGLVLLLLCHQV